MFVAYIVIICTLTEYSVVKDGDFANISVISVVITYNVLLLLL